MSAVILVIEDERDLVDSLEYNLSRADFEVRTALTGAAGLAEAALDPRPDLVLLDLMLPDSSGLEICEQFRADPRMASVPVLMLTARGAETDRVAGFEVGADDYVVKPFSVRELILRVQAILRRAPREAAPSAATSFGLLRIDDEAHRVWVEERELELTALEYKLLLTFLERRGKAQTREVLLTDVWGMRGDVFTRTVDTHVKRLRQRLGPAGRYIETLRGVGYRFAERP